MKLKRLTTILAACAFSILAGQATIATAAPPVVDDYNWLDPSPPGVDMLDWEAAGGGDYEQRDECGVDMPFTCGFFSGPAPLIKAGAPGTYPAGSSAAWVYTVPGGPDAYIKEITAWGTNFQASSTPTEPHGFLGLWNGTSWSAVDSTDEIGDLHLDEVEGEPGDRQVKLGMEADSTVTETDDHWAGLASMTAVLGDDVEPEFDYDPESIPTGWVNEDPFTIPAPSSDDGLGLEFVLAFGTERGLTPWASGGTWDGSWVPGCEGNTTNPCPATTPDDFEIEIRPAELREGESSVIMGAVDPMFNVSNDGTGVQFDLKVDTIKPEIDLSGSFMAAPGMVLTGPDYTIDADAFDGEPGKENSGVIDLRILIDDVPYDADSAPCTTENCSLDLSYGIDTDMFGNGEHVMKVKATDAVGHVTTETIEFEIDR